MKTLAATYYSICSRRIDLIQLCNNKGEAVHDSKGTLWTFSDNSTIEITHFNSVKIDGRAVNY